jgi:hypothetical protein
MKDLVLWAAASSVWEEFKQTGLNTHYQSKGPRNCPKMIATKTPSGWTLSGFNHVVSGEGEIPKPYKAVTLLRNKREKK